MQHWGPFAQKNGARRFTIEVLTPLHIGTGETLDPLDYIAYLDRNAGREIPRVALFDLASAVTALATDQRQALDDLLATSSYARLRGWLRDQLVNGDLLQRSVRRFSYADRDLVTAYSKEVGGDRSTLEIHPTMTDAEGRRALLPGSSIKGALRTAWLNRLVGRMQAVPTNVIPRYFERDTVGDPYTDVFRTVSVGDLTIPGEGLGIMRVHNLKRGGLAGRTDANSFRMYFEFVLPQAAATPVTTEGRIGFASPPDLQAKLTRNVQIPSLDELWAAARDDARRELEREQEFFDDQHPAGKFAGEWLERIKAMPASETLLKLGRFGGVYSKTLDKVRAPQGRSIGGKNCWGNTRFVVGESTEPAARQLSCGWCRLALV